MKSYEIRTYGCQMNVHDSERLAGLLEAAGYVRAPEGDDGTASADVVVFNTCAVRENADNRLYGNLGRLAPKKAARARHADRRRRLPGAEGPRHDRQEGPLGRRRLRHPQHRQPAGAAGARPDRRRGAGRDRRVAGDLPLHAADPARVAPTRPGSSISVGCNNTCTFCIVPALRGKEKDRRPGDILAEVEALVAEGVVEVTLLGQNVNAYGSDIGDREAFGKLLRACGRIEGLERVRFTSPHPRDFTDDVIAAMLAAFLAHAFDTLDHCASRHARWSVVSMQQ